MRHLHSWIIPATLILAGPARAGDRSGEELFNTTCAGCHGTDAKGAPAAATGMNLKMLDLTDCRATNREPDEDWMAVISDGGPARGFHRMMPAFGEVLTREEREALIVYARGFCPDPAWPRGDLNFPRPLVTEKAFVEDEFVVTAGMATGGAHNVDGKLVYEQRILARQQFEVIVPFGMQKDAGGSREAGIGDIAAGVKRILVASLAAGTVLSVAGEVVLPTGNQAKGFGKGVFVFEPFLSLGQRLPWDSFLHLQTGAEIPLQEKDGVEREGFGRLALGTSFTQRHFGRVWTPMIEAVAVRELAAGAPTSLDLVPQLQVTLSRRLHVMASLGASFPTLQRAGRDPQVMFYFLWDWFDGGLFEAW
jgi:hypothetical protein